MKEFEFEGFINLKGKKQPFKKTIRAESKKHALDLLYSGFGSMNKMKRTQIKIKDAEKEAKSKAKPKGE